MIWNLNPNSLMIKTALTINGQEMYHRKYRHVERIMMQIFRNLQKIGMRSEHFHRRQSRPKRQRYRITVTPSLIKSVPIYQETCNKYRTCNPFQVSTKNFRFLKSRYTKPIPIMINKVEYPHWFKKQGPVACCALHSPVWEITVLNIYIFDR